MPDTTAVLFAPVNPKAADSKCFRRYAAYCNAKSIGELRALNPAPCFKPDLKHDLHRGYAALGPLPARRMAMRSASRTAGS
jgi:hypothetical protein